MVEGELVETIGNAIPSQQMAMVVVVDVEQITVEVPEVWAIVSAEQTVVQQEEPAQLLPMAVAVVVVA